MQRESFEKLQGFYYSLEGIKQVFDDVTKKGEGVGEKLVTQYESLIDDLKKSFPNLNISFEKKTFFRDKELFMLEDDYYDAGAIKANIARNLGVLKSKVSQVSQTPVTQAKSFNFVSDKKIRKILERDYQEIQKSIISNCWKSTIILSGGSIEAILLDLLLNNRSRAKSSSKAARKDLKKWDLNDLIDVAVDIKLVKKEVARLSHTTREYRNLVHPGVEIRSGLKVEQEEAKIAVEVLNILIRELS